jgi:hypothetical protein
MFFKAQCVRFLFTSTDGIVGHEQVKRGHFEQLQPKRKERRTGDHRTPKNFPFAKESGKSQKLLVCLESVDNREKKKKRGEKRMERADTHHRENREMNAEAFCVLCKSSLRRPVRERRPTDQPTESHSLAVFLSSSFGNSLVLFYSLLSFFLFLSPLSLLFFSLRRFIFSVNSRRSLAC